MEDSFTLTKKEYDSIVEGCAILSYTFDHGMGEVLHPNIMDKVKEARQHILKGIQNCLDQVSLQETKRYEYFEKTREHHRFMSVWSVHEIDDFAAKHPYIGIKKLTYLSNSGVGSATIQGETWLDLYKAAEQLIVQSNDVHHIFIERFTVEKDNGEYVLVLTTGS